MSSSKRRNIAPNPLPNMVDEKENFVRQMGARLGERIHAPYGHVSIARQEKRPKGSVAPIY